VATEAVALQLQSPVSAFHPRSSAAQQIASLQQQDVRVTGYALVAVMKKQLSTTEQALPAHIPSLDGARGLAVLLVLLDHGGDANLIGGINISPAGKWGVYLFFALSAFLLTYPFCLQPAERIVSGRIWANYFLRRFLRIFPLFFMAILVTSIFEEGFANTDIVHHLLLQDGQWHFWTIPVEFKYYFVLPLIIFAAVYLWQINRILSVVALGLTFLFLRFGFFPIEERWSMDGDILLERCVQIFLVGTLAGIIFAIAWTHREKLQRSAWLFECCAFICLIVIALRIPAVNNLFFENRDPEAGFSNDVSFAAVLWPLLLLTQLFGTGIIRWFLEARPLRYLGMISFSAYLWHRLILEGVEDLALSPLLRLVLFLGAVFAVSTATYYLVERPLSRVRLRSQMRPAQSLKLAPAQS
jgi:peptidoglycan/LPS O-acetylase OafA/YrhL